MKFIVLGYDGTDEQAKDRRMAVREQHLKMGKELAEKGQWLYGCAILNDAGEMAGSMIVCEFPDKETLYKEWLDHEPYIKGDVWREVKVNQAVVPNFLD